jgi:hypothetical protein
MNEELSVIFVSVGNPNHNWELATKVRVEVDIKNGQTMIQAAKLFRKELATQTGRKPSQLWFEIYRTPDHGFIPLHRNWRRLEMFL